ncbi:FKBP12-associated protein [Ceratobasidium sp. 423]|nr:FKBP12-associated protein [Ceratobasidium sp. 423]
MLTIDTGTSIAVNTNAKSVIAAKVLCETFGAPKNARHVVPLAGKHWTVGIILATELAILATVGHARRFVENHGKNAGILALSPVMRLLPAHQSMQYLVLRSSPRLADALGISESARFSSHNQVTWSPDLVAFTRGPANQPFVKNMEKALADFVAGDKKAHVLPHMPEVRRKILTEVAEVYRITTQLIDEEPRRSVQLIRRVDSRVPTPLLSQASAPPPSRLGSLGDLRKPATVIKPASSGGSSASIAPAWRSGTPPSHVTPNVMSGSPALNSGPSTSGNLPPGSGGTPWSRPNVAPVVRTPTPSAASRVVATPLERGHVGGTRGDVPANWEDE